MTESRKEIFRFLEAEGFRTVDVSGALSPQCEVFDASERSLFTLGDSERATSTLHQLGEKEQRLVREHWRRGDEHFLAGESAGRDRNLCWPLWGCYRLV